MPLADRLWAWLITFIFLSLRLLPARLASGIGDRLTRRLGPLRHPSANHAAIQNLRRIRPGEGSAALQEAVARMWGNVGRLQAETAVIDRMWEEANITVHNEAGARRALNTGRPLVFVFAHLGNWELLAICALRFGVVLNVVYENLPDRLELDLALRARARLGYRLVPPDLSGVRLILSALTRSEAIALAIDEFKDGNVIAPCLGRSKRPEGNARLAVKLARRFNALVVPCYCLRTAPFAFELTFDDPLESPSAEELDARCESWIRAHPEQWYMLPRLRLE